MARRIAEAVLLGALLALAGACSDSPQLGILTPYGAGYSDGCDSGYADYGLAAFEYRRGGVFGGGDYGAGWEKGYADCLAFIRAAAL
ncbi:MAG: hypothetical protein ACFCVH_15135 [Alphaproteobacteria bacterium]